MARLGPISAIRRKKSRNASAEQTKPSTAIDASASPEGTESGRRPRRKAPTETYTDPEGNTLTLRRSLSAATIAKIGEPPSSAAASIDDAWQRREEMLFERLVVSWEVAGLPISGQKMLIGRYRMATPEERRWVRETIEEHLKSWIPGL